MRKGDRVRISSPGGGGYGDPVKRERSAIERDLRLGYTTPEHVKDAYGIDPGNPGNIKEAEDSR